MNEQDIPEPVREMVAGIGQGTKRDHDKARRSIPALELAEAMRARRDANWRRRVQDITGGESFGPMVEVAPDRPCDRCGHASRLHTGPDRGSVCRVAGAKVYAPEMVSRRPRATRCWCDGFVSGVR